MTLPPRRVTNSADLGRARRLGDTALGLAAIIPILACAALAQLAPTTVPMLAARGGAVIWSACLLAFFAGVRRGLTFSEAAGARLGELATMLSLFVLAVVTLVANSPAVAAFGLACVGLLDARAARRGEVPRYFRALRLPQMAICAAALILIQIRTG